MSNKLASAIVCIGVAVGSLSAPRSPKSNGQTTTTLGSVNAPLETIAGLVNLDVGALQPGKPGTNTFEVTLQQ